MQLTKFMLILIFCVELNQAGFMDRFKSSYNWISKVDYKINLWPMGKKENSTNPEANSTVVVNQTESSLLSSTTLNQIKSTLIANQTESAPTTLPSDSTVFQSTAGNIAGSSMISNQTEASMPTTSSIQLNSEQINRTESNLAFSTANSPPSIDTENKQVETTARPAEPARMPETTTEMVLLENDSQTKLISYTSTNSPSTFTEPVNLASSTDLANQTNNESFTTIISTESHSSSTDGPPVLINITRQVYPDATESEQKMTTVTPVSNGSSTMAFTVWVTTKENTKQPVESSTATSSNSEETSQNANHSVEQTTTERFAYLQTSTLASAQTSEVTSTHTKPPTTGQTRVSTTSTTIASTIKATRRPVQKSNTPIIVKFLNLRKMTPGSKAVMKNKEGENDNIIYRDIRTYNYVREKLDETFVKFINTFYYSSNRRI